MAFYAVHKLRNEQGLDVQAFDGGADVGGTWYLICYPGALSDSEKAMFYRYSFDKDLLNEWTWKDRYLTQPEVLDYLKHVADRFDLRRSYQFNTKVIATHFNEDRQSVGRLLLTKGNCHCEVSCDRACMLLSSTNVPKFKGC